jgi:hypothetical protein
VSENRPTYIINPLPPNFDGTREIRCECGTLLGFMVRLRGNARMMIGNHLVTEITSVCSDCHLEFHWKADKKEV